MKLHEETAPATTSEETAATARSLRRDVAPAVKLTTRRRHGGEAYETSQAHAAICVADVRNGTLFPDGGG